MMRNALKLSVILVGLVIILASCSNVVCHEPEIITGDVCCEDLNRNHICDNQEDEVKWPGGKVLGEKQETGEVKNMFAVIDTNKGTIKVKLFNDKAPRTVDNFVKLVRDGFYDGLKFHRVIDGFMLQTGDPDGDGTGGPGYIIKDEFHDDLKHDKPGMLSMANRGPDTGGSQFFITVAATPWLDGKHAIFGEVVEGYNFVEEISKVEKDARDMPVEDVIMKKVEIVEE
jgi:cyclophilin family peptidyl-prolyl cis-trans isomerase